MTNKYIEQFKQKWNAGDFEASDGFEYWTSSDDVADFLRKCLDEQKKDIIEGLPKERVLGTAGYFATSKYHKLRCEGFDECLEQIKDYIQSI